MKEKSKTRFTRRKFLKAGAMAAVGVTSLLTSCKTKEGTATKKKVRYGMVIDLERCFGCRACMVACKVENNTPEGIFWMYVFRFEAGEYPNTRVWYMPRPCMHCDNPSCVRVCPVGATYKNNRGMVMQDSERCIGCRYCMQACPYGVRYFNDAKPKKRYYLDWQRFSNELNSITGDAIPPYANPDLQKSYPIDAPGHEGKKAKLAGGGKLKGVVEKCTFCIHRVEKGLKPACIANCPVGALHFGDLNDPESEVSKLLAQNRAFRLLEDMGTNPKVFYIGQAPPGIGAREYSPVRKVIRGGKNGAE